MSSGSLRLQTQDRGTKPLDPGYVMVLLANGRVEKITVSKNGKIMGDRIVKDWGVLKD